MSGGELLAADLPFVGVDAHEVGFFPGFQQRHAAADLGVAQDDRGCSGFAGLLGDPVEGAQQRVDVVAVDALDVPAERRPFVGDRFDAQHPGGGAVGLQGVDVDHRGQVAQPVMACAHRRLPRRALVELTVGEEVEDPRRRTLVTQPQGHADRDGQAVAQRAAGDLHAGGVAGHSRHRQPGPVGAVGVEFVDVDDAGFGQRGVQPDGVVTGRQQEPVPALPVRILGAVAQLVGVDGGEHVGGAEGLPDVALALGLAHVEDVVAHAVGGRRHLLAAVGLDGECHRQSLCSELHVGRVGLGGGGLVGQLPLARPPGLPGDQCRQQTDRGVAAEQQGRPHPAERDEQQRGDERGEAGHHRRNLVGQ